MNIKEMLITPNKYSRPGTKIGTIKNIVVHWVGNAGSTAENNAKYFNNLKDQTKTYASSHYIIGNDGLLVKCVPEDEVAYHANHANSYSIGIEVCHPDWTGEYTTLAHSTLIDLLVDLCTRYNLEPTTAIIRHYDVTGKICPKYYVDNPIEWDKLKLDVKNRMTKDEVLEGAVNAIIGSGININAASWNDLSKINLKNVPALLAKLGGTDNLIKQCVISSADTWLKGTYTKENVRSLLIKYSTKCQG